MNKRLKVLLKFLSVSVFVFGFSCPANFQEAAQTNVSRAIDTTAYDTKNVKAVEEFERNPQTLKKKRRLAAAFAERGFALIEAAQYKAALGDLRKSLKLNPKNLEVKRVHNQIIDLYKSLNRKPPKEGEEPAPLLFQKKA